MKIGNTEVTNPLEILECIVAFDDRDYSLDNHDRMLYAIILGWDDDSYKKFGWSGKDIEEYKLLRKRFEELREVKF